MQRVGWVLDADIVGFIERRRAAGKDTCNAGCLTAFLISIANHAGPATGIGKSVCMQTQATLHYESGCSISSQEKMIRILVDEGLVRKEHRSTVAGVPDDWKANQIFPNWGAIKALIPPDEDEISTRETPECHDDEQSGDSGVSTHETPECSGRLGSAHPGDSGVLPSRERAGSDDLPDDNQEDPPRSDVGGGGDLLISTAEEIPEDKANGWMDVQWLKVVRGRSAEWWEGMIARWLELTSGGVWTHEDWARAVVSIYPPSAHASPEDFQTAVQVMRVASPGDVLMQVVRYRRCIDDGGSRTVTLRRWLGEERWKTDPRQWMTQAERDAEERRAKRQTENREHERLQAEIRERDGREQKQAEAEASRLTRVREYFAGLHPATQAALLADALAMFADEHGERAAEYAFRNAEKRPIECIKGVVPADYVGRVLASRANGGDGRDIIATIAPEEPEETADNGTVDLREHQPKGES